MHCAPLPSVRSLPSAPSSRRSTRVSKDPSRPDDIRPPDRTRSPQPPPSVSSAIAPRRLPHAFGRAAAATATTTPNTVFAAVGAAAVGLGRVFDVAAVAAGAGALGMQPLVDLAQLCVLAIAIALFAALLRRIPAGSRLFVTLSTTATAPSMECGDASLYVSRPHVFEIADTAQLRAAIFQEDSPSPREVIPWHRIKLYQMVSIKRIAEQLLLAVAALRAWRTRPTIALRSAKPRSGIVRLS